MARLNLKNQAQAVSQIKPKLTQFRNQMELRKELWHRAPMNKKRYWVKSGKDPIMALAFQIYDYLDKNFFGGKHGYDKGI